MSNYNWNSISIDSSLSNTILPSLFDYQTLSKTILWYASAIGSLMYIIIITWLDIEFALSIISKYCNNLDSMHVAAVTQIL